MGFFCLIIIIFINIIYIEILKNFNMYLHHWCNISIESFRGTIKKKFSLILYYIEILEKNEKKREKGLDF